ncbi:transposase family protein [archaeon]|nr:transposase family protein [archaeon]
MKKLNKRKVRWIVREFSKGELSHYSIAKTQHITPQHARRVYIKYNNTKDPLLLPPGRKPSSLSKEEESVIEKIFNEYYVGAVILEQILKERGVCISHNKIHKYLKEKKLAKNEPMKQRRRKWVRYERKHSLSLVHSDWFEFEGWKIILIEDDASRFITGYGKFKYATAENTLKVIKESLRYGKPKQFHSDHGSVYTSNDGPNQKKGESKVEKYLKGMGIQQIFARVKHPQSNGKLERLVGTIKKLWNHTGSFEKAIKLYNYTRPHMSLTLPDGKLRTPYKAFLDKMRKEEK